MDKMFPIPAGLSKPSPKPPRKNIADADVYVSPSGRQFGEGTVSDPVSTLESALDIVRCRRSSGTKEHLTIAVGAGEYRTSGLTLSELDSDISIRAQNDGEAILNGGVAINPADFEPINENERARLHGDAKVMVVKADLKKYGLTPADWGKIYAFGNSNSACKYDGDTEGVNCEVYCDGRRMTLARWPNAPEFAKIDEVFDQGDVREFPPQNYFHDWNDRRNHRAGSYIMDIETNNRVKSWSSYEDIWLYGYFFWDWADGSTPVASIDTRVRMLSPGFVSPYAARKGAPYYFFNVFEELDEPGEWYLDRKEGILYLWPYSDTPNVEISISRRPILTAEDVRNFTLDGFTVKGTCADGISITGSGCVVENCVIKNVLGNGVVISGTHNTVRNCEITRTGRCGVILSGGDCITLTPSYNRVENNLVHDWAEVYLTYQPAFSLSGVGCVCAHNEIYNSTHAAIIYGGNDHLIEYNIIHDVGRQSTDAGAIYAGMNWTAYGTVIRYNCIYNLGYGRHCPDGIYWDDALSGQTAYGNILVNIPKFGFLIGGGRDNRAFNNLIINCSEESVFYDDRARDGVKNCGWAHETFDHPNALAWLNLRKVPFRSERWAEKYPSLAAIRDDFGDVDDPAFPPNPAGAFVAENVFVDKRGKTGRFAPSVIEYGEIRDNVGLSYKDSDDLGFVDMENGDYRFRADSDALRKLPSFPEIPFSKIGRE